MKAIFDGQVVAESAEIVENSGYQYFPPSAVKLNWLEKSLKTPSDLECPHGVQFYDVVIDGVRHARNAWIYESPQPAKQQIKNLVGFWKDVKIV
jgi:uncharacterized protein (DUF427 family)